MMAGLSSQIDDVGGAVQNGGVPRPRKTTEEFDCPICGETVPVGSVVCPECGADETTGWSADTIYDGTGIEDPADFDYEDTMRREAGGRRTSVGQVIVWIVAIGLVAVFVWRIVRGQ